MPIKSYLAQPFFFLKQEQLTFLYYADDYMTVLDIFGIYDKINYLISHLINIYICGGKYDMK